MDFTLEGKAEDDISREEVSEVTESAREIIRGKLREHFDGKGRMSPFMSWNFCWDSIAARMMKKSSRMAFRV